MELGFLDSFGFWIMKLVLTLGTCLVYVGGIIALYYLIVALRIYIRNNKNLPGSGQNAQ